MSFLRWCGVALVCLLSLSWSSGQSGLSGFEAANRLYEEGKYAEAVAAYDSYELGFRMLSDEGLDLALPIADGRFRIISKPEQWQALMSLLPILRTACRRAIEDAERTFDVELPKYW